MTKKLMTHVVVGYHTLALTDVIVDAMTVRPVSDAAPRKVIDPAVALKVAPETSEITTFLAVNPK